MPRTSVVLRHARRSHRVRAMARRLLGLVMAYNPVHAPAAVEWAGFADEINDTIQTLTDDASRQDVEQAERDVRAQTEKFMAVLKADMEGTVTYYEDDG